MTTSYVSKGCIKHFNDCEEIAGQCSAPALCATGIPVFPTRIALSQRTKLPASVKNPYKGLSIKPIEGYENVDFGLRLLRGGQPDGQTEDTKGGHIYVYDGKVFYHYEVDRTGQVIYSPWQSEKDGMPIGKAKGLPVPYMTLPEDSTVYIAYSPGAWNWEMLKRFKENEGELREKIGIKVDLKAWKASKSAPMTFQVTHKVINQVDELMGAMTTYPEKHQPHDQEPPSSLYSQAEKSLKEGFSYLLSVADFSHSNWLPDFQYPCEHLNDRMERQANRMEWPDPEAKLGVVLYDPVGLATDIAHVSGKIIHALQEMRAGYAYWSARTVESLSKQMYAASMKNNPRSSSLENIARLRKETIEVNRKISPNFGEHKPAEEHIRDYLSEKGDPVLDNIRTDEWKDFLSKAEERIRKDDGRLIHLGAIRLGVIRPIGSDLTGLIEPLSMFYDVGETGKICKPILQDLRSIWASVTMGLSVSASIATELMKLANRTIMPKSKAPKVTSDENPFLKALAGPEAGAVLGGTGLGVDDVLKNVDATQAGASLWSEITAASEQAKLHKSTILSHERSVPRTIKPSLWDGVATKLIKSSFGVTELKLGSASITEVLEELHYKPRKSGNRINAYSITKENTTTFFPTKMASNLKAQGVHWVGAKTGLAFLELFIAQWNIRQALKKLEDSSDLILHLGLYKELSLGAGATAGAISLMTASLAKGATAYKLSIQSGNIALGFATLAAGIAAYQAFVEAAADNQKGAYTTAKKVAGVVLGAGAVLGLVMLVGISIPFGGWVFLGLVAVGAIIAAWADKFDINTLPGWAMYSFWGNGKEYWIFGKKERFENMDKERKQLHVVLYTPKLKDHGYQADEFTLTFPHVTNGTEVLINGKSQTLSDNKLTLKVSTFLPQDGKKSLKLTYCPVGCGYDDGIRITKTIEIERYFRIGKQTYYPIYEAEFVK